MHLFDNVYALRVRLFAEINGALIIINIAQNQCLKLIPNVTEFIPIGSDPTNGEVHLLLCVSRNQDNVSNVIVVDTRKNTVTKLIQVDDKITDIRVTTLGDTLIIAIVIDEVYIRFLKYKAPMKAQKSE